MKVFLKVAVDIRSIEDGEAHDPEKVKDAVQEAIEAAIYDAQDRGFSHEMSEAVSILFDYSEVVETDMEDQF